MLVCFVLEIKTRFEHLLSSSKDVLFSNIQIALNLILIDFDYLDYLNSHFFRVIVEEAEA